MRQLPATYPANAVGGRHVAAITVDVRERLINLKETRGNFSDKMTGELLY